MTEAIVILSFLLLLSITLNAFLIWYIRSTLSKLLFISENLSFLKEALRAYAKHLKAVYQLEPFHGDETIKFLFEHSQALLDKISEFNEIISLSDEQEVILDDREIEIITGEPTAEEEAAAEKTIGTAEKKHVFYGGSRRGNH